MVKLASNHTESGVIDYILIERCFWFISLETCSNIYLYLVFISHAIGFVLTLLFTLQCCKIILRSQHDLRREQRQADSATSGPTQTVPEGGQATPMPGTGVNQAIENQEGQNDERRRMSSIMVSTLENVKICDPYIMGILTYYLLMSFIGATGVTAISNKKIELLKICTSIITFGNVISFVVTLTTIFEMYQRKRISNIVFDTLLVLLAIYGTLVLWSYVIELEDVRS